jgi:predicted regulator of Ras-like GTPase activity (Roadblock/LC7/MglB family)
MKNIYSFETETNSKSHNLNIILDQLLKTSEILAAIVADWQGLVIASKLPDGEVDGIDEDLIAATTLFSLSGAEDTRRELENTLLGKKLDFLLIMTEGDNSNKFMIICPVNGLGYIACLSNIRQDLAVIKMNMKKAAKEILKILIPDKVASFKDRSIIETMELNEDNTIEDRYNRMISKIDKLKNLQLTERKTTQSKYQKPSPSYLTKNYEIKFRTKNQLVFTIRIKGNSPEDAMKRCIEAYPNYEVEFLEVNEFINKPIIF